MDIVENIENRISLTRLRCCVGILEEEKGRQLEISKDQRTCKQCFSLEIKDLKLKRLTQLGYDILSDDARCFKLLNMGINPQFRPQAQIHFIKNEGRLAIEK